LTPAQLPRKWQPPRRIDEGEVAHNFADCVAYHRVESWFAFLDVIVQQIEERFSKQSFQHIANAEDLLMQAAKGLPFDDLLTKFGAFYNDFDIRLLDAQLQILHSTLARTEQNVQSVASIAKTLTKVPGAQVILSELWRFVKLLLVVPASAATAERSFSSLRRVKSYLRSTISQGRLNHVMILHSHQDRYDLLDMTKVAQEFITSNEQRAAFFGNF
jgi:hypothetical protein